MKEWNLQLGWIITGDGNGGMNICKYSGETAMAKEENNALRHIIVKYLENKCVV